MKNVLLIGAGRFGRHIAMQLSPLGHQVMAVDTNEERINDVLPFVTNAQIGDSTNAEFLRSLGIGNFDVCFVTISGNFQNSLETTSLLKELGAKCVVSRAERDVQAKFLLRNGADHIVYAMAIEALGDAAVKHGIPRADAYRIVSQMVLGTAKLQLATGQHPAAMKDAVCSPGGATIKGVVALEDAGMRSALVKAIDATLQ